MDVPERFNFARDVLDELATDPDKLAIWWRDSAGTERKMTFAELCRESRRVCNWLTELGVRRGDVVLVALPGLIEWWVVNVACLRMGAVMCTSPTQLGVDDLAYRLQESEAVCVITDSEVATRVDAAFDNRERAPFRVIVGDRREGWASYRDLSAGASDLFDTVDTRADEIALLYFTSGTAGLPKIAAHTHVSYPLRHRDTGVFWLDLHDGDLHWNLGDTGWAKAGWSSVFGPWNQGAAVFVVHAPRFDPHRTLELLASYPIDTMCAAPTVYRRLLLEDVKSVGPLELRHCVAAGEPLDAETLERWREVTGITIRDGYGQTETSLLVASVASIEARPGSMGKPVPGYDVQIINDAGNVLPADQEGDIAVRVAPERPLGLFAGYWKNPEATAAAFRGDWYLTGDRAYRDDDGYFWFVGRADDVIITSGYRVGPFEVESALLEHEAVAEAAVVSSPDEVRGEVVKAFVVLKPGHSPSDRLVADLQAHVKATTAPYKYPRRIEFLDSLPKTVSGKSLRAALREAEWEEHRE